MSPAPRLRVRAFLLIALVLLALRLASSATAGAAFFLLAGYALTGYAQAIQALALSWLFSMLSSGVAPEVPMAAVGRYAVIFGAALSVVVRELRRVRSNGVTIHKLAFATLLLGAGIIAHSLVFSVATEVSLLKGFLWTVTFVLLLVAWSRLEAEERKQLEMQLFGGLLAVVLVSLPLVGTGLGYLRNDHGFQGVLNHPQAYGPTVALLAAWLGSRIFAERYPSLLQIGFFVLCLVMIVLSEARTAGLGLMLSLLMAGFTGKVLARQKLRDYLPGLRSRRVWLVIYIGLLTLVAIGPILGSRLADYIYKGTDASNVAEAYELSRGRLIENMWDNIRSEPFRGIGFGVASNPFEMDVERDPVLGLPTSAPIEKGVVFLAIWEELGLLGALAVLSWLWLIVKRAANAGMAALTVCLTVLFLNFGEATLFSPSGMGMLSLILLAWAATGRSSRKGHARG